MPDLPATPRPTRSQHRLETGQDLPCALVIDGRVCDGPSVYLVTTSSGGTARVCAGHGAHLRSCPDCRRLRPRISSLPTEEATRG